jgi:hypothetical protein
MNPSSSRSGSGNEVRSGAGKGEGDGVALHELRFLMDLNLCASVALFIAFHTRVVAPHAHGRCFCPATEPCPGLVVSKKFTSISVYSSLSRLLTSSSDNLLCTGGTIDSSTITTSRPGKCDTRRKVFYSRLQLLISAKEVNSV